jgi:hypothetical protein
MNFYNRILTEMSTENWHLALFHQSIRRRFIWQRVVCLSSLTLPRQAVLPGARSQPDGIIDFHSGKIAVQLAVQLHDALRGSEQSTALAASFPFRQDRDPIGRPAS